MPAMMKKMPPVPAAARPMSCGPFLSERANHRVLHDDAASADADVGTDDRGHHRESEQQIGVPEHTLLLRRNYPRAGS